MKKFVIISTLVLALFSCKTDFDINAPYEKIPIVYGVLDQEEDTQFIKINKSFLGTNNTEYSKINDSLYFTNVTARVEELDEFEGVGRVWQLQSKLVTVDENKGIFFTGTQRVYYFVPTTPLDASKNYRIVGEGDGKKFTARTNIIDGFTFANPFRLTAFRDIILSGGVGTYGIQRPKWVQSDEAESYDVTLRFFYTEHKNGSQTEKYIDWKMGSKNPTTSSNTIEMEVNTEGFFILLNNSAQLKDTTGVTKRVIKNCDIRVTSANFTLDTYIGVSRPNQSISFDKPDYTNIEGGRGVFGSRYTAIISFPGVSEKTIEELFLGPYTTNFKFCTDDTNPILAPYFCP